MMQPEEIIEKSGGPNASEHAHQSAYFCKASLLLLDGRSLWALPFAIPNGGLRDKVTAARLKAEGVKPGVPDIFVPHARHGRYGLFIEMKRPGYFKSDVKEEQLFWLNALFNQGFACLVAGGWLHAVQITEKYLYGAEEKESTILLV